MFAINSLNTNLNSTGAMMGGMNAMGNLMRSVTGNESQAQLKMIQQNEKDLMSAKIRDEITALASGHMLKTNENLEKKKMERLNLFA